jgi:hypothetical protein
MKQDQPNNPERLTFLDNETGKIIGRDPRDLTPADLIAAGHNPESLLKIIRAFYIDHCGGDVSEVRKCTDTSNPLWPYRMGTNPFAKRNLTDEQKAAARDRMTNARAKRSVAA